LDMLGNELAVIRGPAFNQGLGFIDKRVWKRIGPHVADGEGFALLFENEFNAAGEVLDGAGSDRPGKAHAVIAGSPLEGLIFSNGVVIGFAFAVTKPRETTKRNQNDADADAEFCASFHEIPLWGWGLQSNSSIPGRSDAGEASHFFVTLHRARGREGQGFAEGEKIGIRRSAGGEKNALGAGENGTGKTGFVNFCGEGPQIVAEQKYTLGFEGTANPNHGNGQLFFQKSAWVGAVFDWTFKNVGEHDAEFLKFGEDGFDGFSGRVELNGLEDGRGFALEERIGRVQKIGILLRGDACQKKRLDVQRSETRGPGEALQTARNMSGTGGLSAAVTREDGIRSIWHRRISE
jgi:hypothetical protein